MRIWSCRILWDACWGGWVGESEDGGPRERIERRIEREKRREEKREGLKKAKKPKQRLFPKLELHIILLLVNPSGNVLMAIL